MKRLALLIGVLGLAAAAGSLLSASDLGAPDTKSRALASSVHETVVAAPGWVEPATEERELSAELRGKLTAVLVDEGDAVQAGQVLARIDDGEYAAQVLQAEALIRQREAELEKLVNAGRPEERRKARAELEEAEADLVNARADLARRQPLARQGFTSGEVLDDAEAGVRAAEARVEARRQALTLVSVPRAEDVAIARALLERARAQRAEAEATLARTRITSPVDGTVLHRAHQVGEAVTDEPPTVVFRVGDLRRLRVRADVDETDVGRIAVGMRAFVTADGYAGERFWGTVVRVGTRMGRKTRRTDEPTERLDAKVLETLIDLDPGTTLPVGLRVDTFIEAAARPES